jgi:hypothetical protein
MTRVGGKTTELLGPATSPSAGARRPCDLFHYSDGTYKWEDALIDRLK